MKKAPLFVTLIIGTTLLLSSFSLQAFAHGGEEHATSGEAELHTQLTDEQMRTIIALLQKLVFLLTMKLEAQDAASMYVPPPPASTSEDGEVEDENAQAEMEEHHDEHAQEASSPSPATARLVIEVEKHYEQTHVHVRYVDKPEDMFFVSSPLSDESGMISEIEARTGLSEDAIREALVRL